MGDEERGGAQDATIPDLADLYAALGVIEGALSSGMRERLPSEELLERLRAAGDSSADDSHAGGNEAREGKSGNELAVLRERVLACKACALSAARKNVVFGQGVESPVVLVVGEGPGAEEDSQGLPFVGASGKLLDKMLASIGLSREKNCYIANVVKCRPPKNREPAPDERAACMPYLREQIRLLKPLAILCAGRTAAQALLSTTEGINRLRNRQHQFEGTPLIATFHPSALLRDETLKRPAWEDLKRLRDLLASAKNSPGADSPAAGPDRGADD